MLASKKPIIHDLQFFLGIISILLIIGSLFIYSSSSVYALETFGSSTYFVKKHLFGLFVGLCTLFFACLLPTSFIKKVSPLLFLGATSITALTFFSSLSQHIHGSSRWLKLGRFTFQPSELLKVALILYLAYFLEKKSQQQTSIMHTYLPLIIIIGIPSIILLKQPDFGTTVTLFVATFMLLFIAQFQLKHLFLGAIALLPVGIFLIFLRPYRVQRILTFLNPWQDPKGSGFQVIQSLIAIGSGGFTGMGIGHSKQKFFYLPMQHTDFIFSIIAEETGFLGSVFVILLFILFAYFGMRIAWQLNNKFATYTTLGFVILISLQALINLAVATGLAPTKGLGLPFISYGNTALVCNLFMIGILIRMVYETK